MSTKFTTQCTTILYIHLKKTTTIKSWTIHMCTSVAALMTEFQLYKQVLDHTGSIDNNFEVSKLVIINQSKKTIVILQVRKWNWVLSERKNKFKWVLTELGSLKIFYLIFWFYFNTLASSFFASPSRSILNIFFRASMFFWIWSS